MPRLLMKQIFLPLCFLLMISACSDGDETIINIQAPESDGGVSPGTGSSGDGSGTDSSADCPEGTTEMDGGLCELPAIISKDMTLVSGLKYLMSGRVTVGNGNGQLEVNSDGSLDNGSAVQAVTLTIEPGVEVLGKTGTFANI